MRAHHPCRTLALVRTALIAPILATLTLASSPIAAAPTATATLLEQGYQRKARGDIDGAVASFQQARQAGADPQRIALEIGYLQTGRGSVGDARSQFAAAAAGPDPALAAQAQRELQVLPSRLTADIYADSYGWHRAVGGNASTDLVPTVRARVYLRPTFALDLHLYLYAQATRDAASRGSDSAGVPRVYADDYALTGGGLLLRLAGRRLGLFAQAGPAFDLLKDGRKGVVLDVRGGAFLGLETTGCRPQQGGLALRLTLCSDLYGEGIYVSRFNHNVVGFVRAHLGLGYLVTGPVAWQMLLEGRGAGDRNADYYNNFADAGVVQRWRLLGPVPLDLTAGVNAGRYLGRAGVDPAPAELRYLDLRVLAATHVEF
jgi:hypothetical protein